MIIYRNLDSFLTNVLIVINANYTNSTDDTLQRETDIWNLLVDYILPSI